MSSQGNSLTDLSTFASDTDSNSNDLIIEHSQSNSDSHEESNLGIAIMMLKEFKDTLKTRMSKRMLPSLSDYKDQSKLDFKYIKGALMILNKIKHDEDSYRKKEATYCETIDKYKAMLAESTQKVNDYENPVLRHDYIDKVTDILPGLKEKMAHEVSKVKDEVAKYAQDVIDDHKMYAKHLKEEEKKHEVHYADLSNIQTELDQASAKFTETVDKMKARCSEISQLQKKHHVEQVEYLEKVTNKTSEILFSSKSSIYLLVQKLKIVIDEKNDVIQDLKTKLIAKDNQVSKMKPFIKFMLDKMKEHRSR